MLVVDDGSTDRTADVARAEGAAVLSFGENRGLREGIAAGYRYAEEHGYDFGGRVDADGQHPAVELRRLLALVQAGECDVAIGSRFATGEGYEAFRYEPSPSRRLGTAVPRRSLRVVLGHPFHDATSGMYAVNAKAMPILAVPYESGAPEVEPPPVTPCGASRLRGAGEHARTGERRVEAPRPAGGRARAHGGGNPSPLPALAATTRMTVKARRSARYSTGADNDLHPVCAARLARAAEETEPGDAVLFSGWRRDGAVSEAELMARGWTGRAGHVLLDTAARTTYGNIVGAAAAARKVSAREVVVVTSGWHGRRAAALMRAAVPYSVVIASTDERGTVRARVRELPAGSSCHSRSLSYDAR